MNTYKSFNQVDVVNDSKFVLGFLMYEKDTFTKTFIEKAFGVKLAACYVQDRGSPPTKQELNMGGMEIVLYFDSGKITRLTNSEWGYIIVEQPKQPV